MSILDNLSKKEQFSDTENQIIDYLLEHKNEMENVTIQELAQKVYSSNATIIRLCRKLGYAGFRDFKIAFVKEVAYQKMLTNTIDYSFPFQITDSVYTISQNMYSLFKECMDTVQGHLDIITLGKMVQEMEKAKRTFMFGVGDTELTIRSFINKCVKINYFPILGSNNYEHYYICNQMEKGDCAVFVSYMGSHNTFDDCVRVLKQNSVRVLVLTGNADSFIAKNSDYCIMIPNLEKENKITTFYSQIVFQYILNLMFSILYRDHEKQKHELKVQK